MWQGLQLVQAAAQTVAQAEAVAGKNSVGMQSIHQVTTAAPGAAAASAAAQWLQQYKAYPDDMQGQPTGGIEAQTWQSQAVPGLEGSLIGALAGHVALGSVPLTTQTPITPITPQSTTLGVEPAGSAGPSTHVTSATEAEPLPTWCPPGWKAKWSERRGLHYFFRVDSSGVPNEHLPTGKTKCYWLEQVRSVLAAESTSTADSEVAGI